MALILNIDTSSEICSVALACDGITISEADGPVPNQHAAQLTLSIASLVAAAGYHLIDLSAVAVSSGPGSYTGLRIGTSVAKGLCYGLDIPLIAVPTLQGIAFGAAAVKPDPDGFYVSMIDARRSDAYMAIYDFKNTLIKNDTFVTVDMAFIDSLSSYVKNIYFSGSGSSKCEVICLNKQFGTVIENIICKASNINSISYNRFMTEDFESLSDFEPFYLKAFEKRMING